MHIREPRDFAAVRAQRQARRLLKRLRRLLLGGVAVVIGLILLAYGAYLRPVPALAAKTITPNVPTAQVALAWPKAGQAAISTTDPGVLAETPNQKPVPIASVAKVMTALAVLKKHPLQPGQAGPSLTMTAADVTLYNNYLAQGGSVVKVQAGEQISEYQALQAAMLPSANNLADSLAVWAYGSMDDYHKAANQLAGSLGMNQSTFASDASGFLPETISTPHDLVLLGQAALANPILKEIMAQRTATLPVVGVVSNVNVLLGQNDTIGIKTGNSEQAGGCYLFAASRSIGNGQTVTSVGAIAGSPSLGQALYGSLPLLDSFYRGFTTQVIVPKGTVVAHYSVPWSKTTVTAQTAQDAGVLIWGGSKALVKVQAQPAKDQQPAGTSVGELTVQSDYGQASSPIVLTAGTGQPNWRWRITRH